MSHEPGRPGTEFRWRAGAGTITSTPQATALWSHVSIEKRADFGVDAVRILEEALVAQAGQHDET